MTQNYLPRLYALQKEKAAVASRAKELDAEIKAIQKSLPTGLSSDGAYVVDVKPSVRFDAATAKKNLSPELFESICELKPTSTKARQMLTGYEYEDCQKVVGVTAIVKRVEDIDG